MIIANKHSKARFVFVILVLLFSAPGYGRASAANTVPAKVIAVNDGDTVTIMMNGREYRTRLIGIDAPEMGQEPWGDRARQHLRKMLKDLHWRILVEKGLEEYDKYNRLLVYFWTDDGKLINEQMLADGYAVLFTIQPNSKYADRFRHAQRAARENKIGIWEANGLPETPFEYKRKHPRL